MPFYKLKRVGGWMDGLTVEGEPVQADYIYNVESDDSLDTLGRDIDMVRVVRVFDTNVMVGDRVLSHPVDGLFVRLENCEGAEDPRKMQFDSKNPFGKCLLERHLTSTDIDVDYAVYENVMQVSVRDHWSGNTLFSDYFTKDYDRVKSIAESVSQSDDTEEQADDVVFLLQREKERQKNEGGQVG